jgi:hypothetical protein
VGVSVIGQRSGHQAAKRRKHGSTSGAVMSVRHPEQKGRAWIEKKKVGPRCWSPSHMRKNPLAWCKVCG